jgi:predicted dehydrogenase
MDMWTVAIAGAGRATRELTLPAFDVGRRYADISRAKVVALADPDEERVRAVADQYGINGTYADVESMLDQTDADILIINSPVGVHYEHTMMAIDRGKHFVIEKPATEKVEQLIDIRNAASSRNVKGTVVHNYKFLRGFQKAWKWYEEGRLGEIIHVDRLFMTPPHEDRMEMDKNGWWHKMPGGRLADSLPHHIYVAYPFVGEMELMHVSARKLSDRPWSRCDEADIMLRGKRSYVNIRLSTNQHSLPAGKASFTYMFWLYGTKTNVAVFQTDAYMLINPHALRPLSTLIQEQRSLYKDRLLDLLGRPREMALRGGHNLLFDRFLRYLDERGPNPTPWDEAVHTMSLSQEIGLAMEESLGEATAKVER